IPVSSLYTSAKAAGIAVSYINPNFKNAYIESYNLNVQQALPGGMVSSIGYYGSVGRHLLMVTNANQQAGTASTNRPYLTLSATSPIDPGVAIATNIPE